MSLLHCGWVLIVVLLSTDVYAHNNQHWISISLYPNFIRIKATPPLEQFLSFDLNHDGKLSDTELQSSQEVIKKHLLSRISLRNGAHQQANLEWKSLRIQRKQLSLHLIGKWTEHPDQIELRYDHKDQHDIPLLIRKGQEMEERKIKVLNVNKYHPVLP